MSVLSQEDWNSIEGQQPADIRAGRCDLNEYLSRIVSTVDLDRIFDAPEHQFQKSDDKWRGGCPWHESESGTSFTVNPATGEWYCGGCHKGGGIVQYLHCRTFGINAASPRGPEFRQVMQTLSRLSGLSIPGRKETPEQKRQRESQELRRKTLEQWNRQCQWYLWQDTPESKAAREYMQLRGFSSSDLKNIEAGLAVVNPKLEVDAAHLREWQIGQPWWANYITFPWYDESGRLLTMYGKVSGGRPPGDQPKTLALAGKGTKRSPMYFDRARKSGHRDIVLVEGVTDAALAQVRGDTRVVACVAAELAEAQVETLKRCGVKSVTVALDPDKAGISGSRSCLRQLSEAGIFCYVAPQLPDGKDPDEFIMAAGIKRWRDHIAQAENGFRMVARQIIEEATTSGEAMNDRTTATVASDLTELATLINSENVPSLEAHRVIWDEFRGRMGTDQSTAERNAQFTESKRDQIAQAKAVSSYATGDDWTGLRVMATDRNNFGEVTEDRGDYCTVRFVAPEGSTATVDMPKSELRRTDGHAAEIEQAAPPVEVLGFRELLENHPELRAPVIGGLLRRGETMNLVSASKVGKTFNVLMLAVASAAEKRATTEGNHSQWSWLNFDVGRSRVLLVDTELHKETLAGRLRKIAKGMFASQSEVGDYLQILPTRGTGWYIDHLDETLRGLAEHDRKVDLVIVDALYRAISPEVDENDNRAMAMVYNGIDAVARRHDVALVLVHHSTKGDQSHKAVTDIGSGAGSMARAADTHLTMVPHREEGCVVVRGVCRSFPSPEPFVISWDYPLWKLAPELDPSDIKTPRNSRRQAPPSAPKTNGNHPPESAVQTRLTYFDEGF